MTRKRYAIIGTGKRSLNFIEPLIKEHADTCELVALCDSNPVAVEALAAEFRPRGFAGSLWNSADFETMIATEKVDCVMVLTPDFTHDEYCCRAMRAGADVFTEKPMCIDAEQCQHIVDTTAETGRECRVGFNYRYAPFNAAIKACIRQGTIGRVVAAARRHCFGLERGPSFFHRWNGQMEKSGSLLVHKSTHYLDLLNWFIGSVPKRVFARGGQNFYSKAYAEGLGITERGDRCGACPSSAQCPWFTDSRRFSDADLVEASGAVTGYYRDDCVFRPDKNVPDTMTVMVEYENGASLNYQLVACGGVGSDEIIYGTRGKIITAGVARPRVEPYYADPYDLEFTPVKGGHGGGDPMMFADSLDPNAPEDPNRPGADQHDGAWSILIGVAAIQSMKSDQPVVIRDLVSGLEHPDFAPVEENPVGFTVQQMRDYIETHVWRQ